MGKKMARGLLVAVFALGTQACTGRAWYEGFQERQRAACYKSANQSDVQKCLERVNGATYDDYSKNRETPVGAGK